MELLRIVMTGGFVLGCALGGSGTASAGAEPATASPGRTVRLFISGHSLTDRPFPDHLAALAAASGTSLHWNMHQMTGSSILQRLNDRSNAAYLAEPAQEPMSPSGEDRAAAAAREPSDYDIMIVTEQHRVLDSLIWQDTVRSLREYQRRFAAANANGTTYFFAPWISLSDRTDPSDWILYEKEAMPVWQCVVDQVNRDLAAEGRGGTIRFIPASLALARLVEQLTADAEFAGFEKLDPPARINALFADDVHLTALGTYYVAAVSHLATQAGDLPAVIPSSLPPAQADALRRYAASFMEDYNRSPAALRQNCASGLSLAFASHYAAYTERTYHRREQGILSARIKRLRDTLRFAWRFRHGLE